jgi:hypothetical protein
MNGMPIELTGGLDSEFENFRLERPAAPNMRDSASLWIMDEAGALAFPRVTIDAIGSRWDRPCVQLNLALADGRALRVWDEFPRHSPIGTGGKASILGAGPLRFRCVEPFRRWLVEFEGTAEQSTTASQMAGQTGGKRVKLAFRFEALMAAPPWLMGGMTTEGARLLKSSIEGELMGGLRYEQLCRITGDVDIAGEQHRIQGTGMRVRRQGVRNMAAATGHCQHSALFPSGRAMGAIAFASMADGAPSFNEGFVINEGAKVVPARIAQAPWMTRLVANDEDVPLVLASGDSTIRIAGRTLLCTFDHHLFEMADSAVLQQCAVRYEWDGEETIGLMERCTLKQRIEAANGGGQR